MKRKRMTLLLIMLVMLFMAAPTSAYAELTEDEVKSAVDAQGKEAVSGNLLIWFLCAIAFLKVSQKIDSFMAMLGINVGRTGGGAFSDVIVAMRGAAGMAKMAGGSISAAGGGRSGSSGTASAGGRAAGAGGLAGGLAGMISRQAVSKTAEQATTESASGGIMAGIGSKLYDNSLGEKNAFAQEVISSVATGDGGIMTGDKAVDAFNAYMGNSASLSSSSNNEVQAGIRQEQTNAVQTQAQLQQNMKSSQNISADYEGSGQKEQQEAIAPSPSPAIGQVNEETGEIPYQASVSDSVGSEVPGQADASNVPEVSAAEVFGFANASAVDYSAAEPAADMTAGIDGTTAETIGNEPVLTDYNETIPAAGAEGSGVIEGSAEGYGSPSLPSGTESAVFAGAPPVGAEAYAPMPASASYKDIEIGRGQIRGTEVSDQNPNGIRFAMYHTEKYMKPESGNYATVQSADGAKWYKQYAEPVVKRTPISEQDGKVKQRESIVYELPKPPQRKDRV